MADRKRRMDVMGVQFRDECVDAECFRSMTAETQDIYLRLDARRRRSGLRLARIIARQQILQKIARGRTGPFFVCARA